MIFVFIIILTVFTALVAYVALRGCQVLQDDQLICNIYLVTTIILYICFISGVFLERISTTPIAKSIAFVGNSALIIFFYLLMMFVIVDIIRLANYFLHFAPEGMIVFRKWTLFASLAVIVVVMIIGNYKFNNPEVVHLNLNVNDKPTQNRELRIVVASDIHLGVSLDKKRLQKYVKLINEQNPDMVLVAGDLIDNVLAPLVKQNMNEDLRVINAPLGVFSVPGNHEYISGNIDGVIEFFRRGNIHVLRDSVVLIDDSFYLVGRDDRMIRDRKSLTQLINGIDRTKPIILLDHQPFNLEEAEESGVDLQLSGHTHAGQIFPINLMTNRMFETAHGYTARGNTHYYVSSGLALWGLQYRIGTQSEIVVITLSF